LRRAGLYNYFRSIESAQDPVVTIDGRRIVMLGSNNYLGLANHPEVKQAAIRAIERYGTGCAGSRLLNGTLDLHVELEDRLGLSARSALTFNQLPGEPSVLSCLLSRQDVVFLDSLDHACIIDGARLGFAKMVKFKRNDRGPRRKSATPDDVSKMIVVDGVFNGRRRRLPDLVRPNASMARS
jgi:7-keto-8-aminopelargonate synthetase-like enzyme